MNVEVTNKLCPQGKIKLKNDDFIFHREVQRSIYSSIMQNYKYVSLKTAQILTLEIVFVRNPSNTTPNDPVSGNSNIYKVVSKYALRHLVANCKFIGIVHNLIWPNYSFVTNLKKTFFTNLKSGHPSIQSMSIKKIIDFGPIHGVLPVSSENLQD